MTHHFSCFVEALQVFASLCKFFRQGFYCTCADGLKYVNQAESTSRQVTAYYHTSEDELKASIHCHSYTTIHDQHQYVTTT